ncbi:biliverdin-producing heme oxygenase [Mucilaginibacter sp. cycad4]|uniref:biliverdin-producing heme oxygenase n=1 Tax=Mucilaginibacter sp. cycad4 TaxID=3342096 RepID=UPI002AAC3279|nr:biliverdin-producing heme oxygenase [Mucilaginibacter gossypii]WPV01778.1 biliverdin-producing heme oxygenase [Mucilaginibacter gossypii]
MLSTTIKEATKEAHQQLEKKVVQKLKAIRSNQDYADLLRHFYAYFNHLEKVIAPFITVDVLPDHAQRRNSSFLKSDIEALGGDINSLPETTVPEINNLIQALGALYVMEGSIMGGSIIVQMLAKGGITGGVSFFSGYGPATGQMWGAFISILNASAANDEEETTAAHTANDTFNHFAAVFAETRTAD